MVAWGVVSLAGVPPLDDPTAPERASGPLVALAAVGLGLYGLAVIRYIDLYRRRPAEMLIGMIAAFALLAEAMIAVALGRNWHATWWEWHLLMLGAFALVAWSAQRQWHEERFSDLYLDETAAGEREITRAVRRPQGFTASPRLMRRGMSPRCSTRTSMSRSRRSSQRHGGEIDRLVGDALMATFNRRGDQPDHADARPARRSSSSRRRLGSRRRIRPGPAFGSASTPAWSRCRCSAPPAARTHTAIGDTVNLAARLEAEAPVGGVAIGKETARRLIGAELEPLGQIQSRARPSRWTPTGCSRCEGLARTYPRSPHPPIAGLDTALEITHDASAVSTRG